MNVSRKGIRILNWIKSKVVDHAIILGYHRITKANNDPYFMNVSSENFSEQLEVIRKYAVPISLQDLVKKLEEKSLNGKYVTVTFDDGYSDNYYRAKPLLEKYDIPATVFIPSGKLNSEYWWDKLERLVLSAPVAPEELNLRYSKGSFFWRYNAREKRSPKWSLFSALYIHMQNLQEESIWEILDQLNNLTDNKLISNYRYRSMTIDELLLLTSDSLIQAGSHTITHRNLIFADTKNQALEISQSKIILEETLGKPVFGFSFPNGGNTSRLSDIVKASGYSYACESYNNYTFRQSDIFSLPRFWARDWNGDKFEKWLRGWRN